MDTGDENAMDIRLAVVEDKDDKLRISRAILEDLTDWFGIPESREEYIRDSAQQPFLAALLDGKEIGFLCLKQTGKATVELAVMGVKKEFHRCGAGRLLVERAIALAREKGYSFMQVKTVKSGVYEDYDATNRFYQSVGFQEFEVFPALWDEWNPCQVYVMAL